MYNSIIRRLYLIGIFYLLIFNESLSQISVPNGAVNTSLNSNIGIGTNNPGARLQINTSGTAGLIQLNYSGLAQIGGGVDYPDFAFKLKNEPYNLPSATTFLIKGPGQTFIGDYTGITTSPSMLNVRSNLAITHSNSNSLDFKYSGFSPILNWHSSNNSDFIFRAGSSNLMYLTTSGKLGIGVNNWGSELLRVAGSVRNEGVLIRNESAENTLTGVVNGLEIFTNGSLSNNFAIKT